MLCPRSRRACVAATAIRKKWPLPSRCRCSMNSPFHKPAGTRLPPQYALAAHSVSQLHAVDGGTTYGLPYDSLMPLLWQEGTGMLTCNCAIIALHWRKQTCTFGGYELAPCGLSPRGLFELCLREAEVAADCWRRRNGLPAAAAAAAGGSVGDSSSGKAGRRGRQLGQALGTAEVETGRRVGLCRSGGAGSEVGVSSGGPAADPPRATLEPRRCPELAMQAMSCSRLLMDSSCMAGDRAGAGAAEAGTPVLEGSGGGTGRSRTPGIAGSSGNIAVGEGDQGAGGGSLDRSWCGAQGGEGGDDTQGSSSSSSNSMDTGAWLRDGGPLARRWWRAAVAAVHCAMDKLVGSQGEAFYVHWLLDPSLAMPVPDPGGTPAHSTAHSHRAHATYKRSALHSRSALLYVNVFPGAATPARCASRAQCFALSHGRCRAVHEMSDSTTPMIMHALRCAQSSSAYGPLRQFSSL